MNETFQIPIPGLFGDIAAAAGSVALPSEFNQAPARIRLEILQQWIVELSVLQNAAIAEVFDSFAQNTSRPYGRHELLEEFRNFCVTNGIDIPLDFARVCTAYGRGGCT